MGYGTGVVNWGGPSGPVLIDDREPSVPVSKWNDLVARYNKEYKNCESWIEAFKVEENNWEDAWVSAHAWKGAAHEMRDRFAPDMSDDQLVALRNQHEAKFMKGAQYATDMQDRRFQRKR